MSTADPSSAAPRTVAVITGATGGVGRACATRLATGHRLILVDRDPDALAAFADELSGGGASAEWVAGDVRSPGTADEVAAAVRGDALGPVVCAAGLSSHMAPAEEIFSVNLIGTARVLEALRPHLGPATAAVCVASISGHRGGAREHDATLAHPLRDGVYAQVVRDESTTWSPGLSYAVSKRGVILLCEREAQAWGERGARIVSVSPGLIDTPMGRFEAAQGDGNIKQLTDMSALKRGGRAEEIADLATFLSGPHATYITGCDVRIDGGTVAHLDHHAPEAVASGWFKPRY